MIVEAVDFLDRIAAVEFAMRIVRPDVSEERRTEVALTYAAGKFCAIDGRDADIEGHAIRSGRPRTPIFMFKSDDEIVGAAICSVATTSHPLRLMMLATRPDWRGRGVGFELVEHVIDTARIVGVAPAHEGLKEFFTWSGFRHWHRGAEGGWIGFTRSIAWPSGFMFAVPVAADYELEEARGRLPASITAHRNGQRMQETS